MEDQGRIGDIVEFRNISARITTADGIPLCDICIHDCAFYMLCGIGEGAISLNCQGYTRHDRKEIYYKKVDIEESYGL